MKIIVTVLLLLLVGCGAQNKSVDNGNGNLVKVKNSTIQDVDRNSGQDISRHLVDLATGVADVNDATAVVIGNYAIVGIDVNSKLERSQVGSIKYSVAESLKNDPHGAKAVVIADPDLTTRLREISEDIKNGQPLSGIMNELADISGRLMPEVPADMINPKPRNAPEKPKKSMGNEDKQKLDQEQQDQSKQHMD